MNEYLITCLIGYVLGCFNTAYVIGKIKGFDIDLLTNDFMHAVKL